MVHSCRSAGLSRFWPLFSALLRPLLGRSCQLFLPLLLSSACAQQRLAHCSADAARVTPERHPSAHSHDTRSSTGDHRSVPSPRTQRRATARAVVVAHDALRSFENNGNTLRGVATNQLGAQTFEVWRSSVAPGSSTPKHVHESEEVFIILQGRGRAVIGTASYEFVAPATVIAPAHIPHQFFNDGTEPTDAIVVVGVGSAILDSAGHPMNLPWRK